MRCSSLHLMRPHVGACESPLQFQTPVQSGSFSV